MSRETPSPDYAVRLRAGAVDEAPTTPGLYAWYGILDVGEQDWAMRIVDGEDAGERNLRTLLAKHTMRFAASPLQIQAKAPFSLTWKGELEDHGNADLQTTLSGSGTEQVAQEDPRAPTLQDSLEAPHLREALVRALEAATPFLTSPLYVGVATNLQNRLSQHADMLTKLWNAVAREPSYLQQILRNPKLKNEFAVRAVRAGFSPETLEVWAVDLSELLEEPRKPEYQRKVAEAAEWLLNRWHRPVLGRS